MQTKSWLEISLVVNGELAEAVAEALSRYLPAGVAIESTAIEANAENEGRPSGPLRVYGYLPVNDQLEETRQKIAEALWYLGRIQPLPEAQYRYIQDKDWTAAWKKHYRPISLGERLLILPSWLENPAPERIAIRLDPGMAFGTGTHPSTQLCLEIIEAYYLSESEPPGDSQAAVMIDLGCGTGILAIAALKLGGELALGVDVDPQAIESAQANAAANEAADRLILGAGSLEEIRNGDYPFRQAPLVVANILAPVIVRLLNQGLGELLTPGGRLVLAGILEEQADEVARALENNGLQTVESRQIEDWVALVASH
jgi:ribosomal protein L11 methyltransferase